ncbi:hypothetical protein ABZ342_32945 [Amycolatopsis sp. NPDC005961]|uniref:hypothetical protein n=1 Tax=Amycolatopsis sp. NPDC005961 TaxID=3156720 RepID=UPI0033FDB66A
MSIDLLTALSSLGGVTLGGGLSYAVQRATHHAAEKLEVSRQAILRSEARRAERMAALDRFLVQAQDVERAAINHYHRGMTNDEWQTQAEAAMDRMWVAEKVVRIVCSTAMHQATYHFAHILGESMADRTEGIEVHEFMSAPREAFLDQARVELGE